MRLFLCLTALLLLGACTSATFPQFLTPGDQQLFIQGMEKFDVRGEVPAAFIILQERYPESPWTAKAQTIQSLLETFRQRQQIVKQLQESQQTIRKQNEELQQQLKTLQADLRGLEAERTKLRQLLIDLEQRRQ